MSRLGSEEVACKRCGAPRRSDSWCVATEACIDAMNAEKAYRDALMCTVSAPLGTETTEINQPKQSDIAAIPEVE